VVVEVLRDGGAKVRLLARWPPNWPKAHTASQPPTQTGALLLAIGFRNCDENSSEMSLQGLFELIRYIQWRHLLSHCLNPHAILPEEP
jgi:hypothetical protein